MIWRILLGLVVVLILAFVGFYAWTWRGAMPALAAAPATSSFPPAEIKRGGQLASVGNCTACHTVPGGKPYAGGLPIATPFGTIYATNITPDTETGIGAWQEDAFRRAMREGVGRKGTHFYPAFPYDHFTLTNDNDISAIYAFLMTREPVRQENTPPQIAFPLNWRLFAAAWQMLFLHQGPYQPDTARNAEWNRGAYLVEGLAHCGACHTPRNALGAEEKGKRFGGGVAENWTATALNESSPAPVPWTEEQLYAYLRTGFADQHGYAAGPMQPVVASLQHIPEADVRAIAAYLASFEGPRNQAARQKQAKTGLSFAQERVFKVPAVEGGNATTGTGGGQSNSEGAIIFAGACATCHHEGGRLPVSRPIPLALSSTVNDASPTNFVRIVLEGIHPPAGAGGPIMPGFAGALTNQQIVALANFVRQQFSQKPAWQNIDKALSNGSQQQATAGGAQ